MSEGIQRRLSAVLAADVVGYSRLMGEDEARTLSALRQLRTETLAPKVSGQRGKVVKSMGDGWLVEFASVADAVTCAIEVQEGLAGNEIIKLRIGVHLGDITHEDDDIYGDGVNIAARLQEIAEPGAVVISDIARRSIDDKLATAFVDLGAHALKNISEPVTAYGWGMTPVSAGASALPLPNKPSIAVLPFDNLSGDPSQEYFVDGMVEGITAALSKIKTFFVIARTSAFIFKNRPAVHDEVRKKLGVHYFLEGSVQKAGERVRITAQLVETKSGAHIWADRYDGTLSDIFELQDTIIAKVAGAMHPSIRQAEIDRSRRKRPQDLGAYDFVMRAMPYVWSLDQNDNREALALLEQALEIDPNYGVAQSLAAWCHGQQVAYNWSDNPDNSRAQAKKLANRAVMMGNDDPLALTAVGAAYATIGDQNSAKTFLERAVSLDPNSAWAWSRLGWCKTYAEQSLEAIQHFQRALRLSPYDPMIFNGHVGLGSAYTMANEFDLAIEYFELALNEHPQAVWMYRRLVPAYWMAGRREDAKAGIRRLLEAYPDLTAEKVRKALPFSPEHNTWNCDLLIKAGLPE